MSLGNEWYVEWSKQTRRVATVEEWKWIQYTPCFGLLRIRNISPDGLRIVTVNDVVTSGCIHVTGYFLFVLIIHMSWNHTGWMQTGRVKVSRKLSTKFWLDKLYSKSFGNEKVGWKSIPFFRQANKTLGRWFWFDCGKGVVDFQRCTVS